MLSEIRPSAAREDESKHPERVCTTMRIERHFNHEPRPEKTRLRSVLSAEHLCQQSPFRRSRLLQHLKSICLQRLRILIVAIACQLSRQLHRYVKDVIYF